MKIKMWIVIWLFMHKSFWSLLDYTYMQWQDCTCKLSSCQTQPGCGIFLAWVSKIQVCSDSDVSYIVWKDLVKASKQKTVCVFSKDTFHPAQNIMVTILASEHTCTNLSIISKGNPLESRCWGTHKMVEECCSLVSGYSFSCVYWLRRTMAMLSMMFSLFTPFIVPECLQVLGLCLKQACKMHKSLFKERYKHSWYLTWSKMVGGRNCLSFPY